MDRVALIKLLRTEDYGYTYIRNLPDGKLVGVKPMLYSWRCEVDLDETGHKGGVDYGTMEEAMAFAMTMQRIDDPPPGKWLADKRSCRPGEEHPTDEDKFREWLYAE